MLVRILLDTCTLRNHLHAVGKQLDFGAIRTSTEHLRFSLPCGAGVELLEQLTEGRVSWQEWTSGIPAIDSLLDQRWPLLPTGRLLAAIAGTQTDIPVDIETERRRLRTVWWLLRHSKSTADLERIGWYEAADGKRCATKIKLPQLQAAGSAERDSWKKHIRQVQTLLAPFGIEQATEADILALMKMNQGTYPGDPPDLGDKLDSVARMIACLVAQALKTRDAYNPNSEKRRGDAFDISLLFYVPLPSVICTADENFVNRLRNTGAPHARRVVSVEEFNEIVKRGGVGTLVGDFRTPEDQYRRWSEAAYFNWINRGCPLNDDQRDWFETEPVA